MLIVRRSLEQRTESSPLPQDSRHPPGELQDPAKGPQIFGAVVHVSLWLHESSLHMFIALPNVALHPLASPDDTNFSCSGRQNAESRRERGTAIIGRAWGFERWPMHTTTRLEQKCPLTVAKIAGTIYCNQALTQRTREVMGVHCSKRILGCTSASVAILNSIANRLTPVPP
jgi:hypothetical protein